MNNKNIGLLSAFWDAAAGEHPSLIHNEDSFYSFPPIVSDELNEHLLSYDLPLIPCVDGHNVMVETSVSENLSIDIKFCTSPNFVKDLAGRIIYTGYGPERKDANQWRLNRQVSFPKNCRPVTANIEGADLIENVFLTRFRCLETSVKYEDAFHLIELSYPAANLYPYKVRLDTFYQDGWRLPQTEMLYVNEFADARRANKHGQDILNIWETMHNAGANYEEFYTKLESSGALEKMFIEGCTYIPNFRAKNGYYDVAEDFTINKQRGGRAVEGLHTIIEYKTSLEPRGTILDVIEPGFITPDHIHPAKVIVSDGERYEIEHKAKGMAECPDLTLPHTRCSATWGDTWIPTKPHHFSAPSIWSWGNKTGHFLQTKGPLWDPLHYYYTSVDKVIYAFKNNMVQGSKNFAHVPQPMKKKFHPVVGIKGFDIISLAEKNKALKDDTRPLTGLIRIADSKEHASAGYHPLPLAFEYELSYWNFPELAPQARVSNTKNPLIKVAPIAQVYTNPQQYIQNAPNINEFERLKMPTMVKEFTGNVLEDYPQLNRYLSDYNERIANTEVALSSSFLEEAPKPSEKLLHAYKESDISFYKEVYEMRLQAVERIKKRNDLIDNHAEHYVEQEWKMKEGQ